MEIAKRKKTDPPIGENTDKMSLGDGVSDKEGPATPLKRKHHRRAKKGRKRQESRDEKTPGPPGRQMDKKSPGGKATRKRHHNNQVYLRPTNGPLLNAPKNSTQFIIDDHESSDFVSFSGASGSGRGPGGASGRVQANSASPDDDSFWAEYSERDFQSVYETAHQEEIAEWDRKRLCDEST